MAAVDYAAGMKTARRSSLLLIALLPVSPDLKGFGHGKRGFFWLKSGRPFPEALHFAFVARNVDEVDLFYAAAMAAGARDHLSPRTRHEYYPGYYAADVLDPDGYSIEVVHKS